MAAETSWHRYGTKLRHCRLMSTRLSFVIELIERSDVVHTARGFRTQCEQPIY